MLHFLEELSTPHIVQARKTVLPSRDQPIAVDERHPEDGIVRIAMRVSLDQLHVWYAVEVNAVMQVGDCQIVVFEIGMRTTSQINRMHKFKMQELTCGCEFVLTTSIPMAG
jgi:hypothetical protein